MSNENEPPTELTLESLRDHARENPAKIFPLNSCHNCLAADLTDKVMRGHGEFSDGTKVPKAFATFTRRASTGSYTGFELATALDAIIAGRDPWQVGEDLRTSKGQQEN